ncbi:MAG: hypothetical protein MZV64_33785 [Ignavibacteriales bacterium]|nr:hypothetical protein [Ignavibacteriales bacterium]
MALLQGPRPHELALEHGLRRRPVHGLDRPSPRHRPLGHGLGRDRPGRDRGRGRVPDDRASTTARPATGSRPDTPTGRPWSWPAATTRSGAAPSGSANTAGSGSTAAGSRPSRPASSRRGHRPERGAASTKAATTTRTSSTASAAGPDDRPGRDGPPLGQRRPPRRHRHGGRPEDQMGPGHRDHPRRPRGGAAPRPFLPQALAAAGVRRATR